MDMDDASTSSSTMSMVFTTSHSTPLFSAQWTPPTGAAYAGTCIFLLLLAIASRLLQTFRGRLETRWHDRAVQRRYVVLAGDTAEDQSRRRFVEEEAEDEKQQSSSRAPEVSSLSESSPSPPPPPPPPQFREGEAVLTSRGVEERVRVLRTSRARGGLATTPWRMSVDVPRALVFTVQAGVGYLLMLAVMTLNAGYFLSVLAGLFVGELFVGRFTHMDDGHH